MRNLSRLLVVAAAAAVLLWRATPARADHLRGFWADSWHAGFKTAAQVDQFLAAVRSANCNAAFVQVRRRGQTYYINTVGDPRWTDVSPGGFDSLAYLIQRAHGISPRVEVHVWSDALIIWGSGSPGDPSHAMIEHPDWLMTNSSGANFDGSSYWLDPGHPGVEQYLVDVALDVISRYDIDGFHWDYIRYPGETWGYNATSVARFNARYSRSGTPASNDESWKQWRRDQVSALVRKTYANAIAFKPAIKVSSSVITWGNYGGWTSTSAYTRNFQDWLAWMQEGTQDFVVPMCYYDQSVYPTYYANWINFAKNSRYNRHMVIGQASYENSVTNTVAQTRQALAASTTGKYADGVAFYSYAAPSSTGESLSTLIQALTQPSGYDPITPPVFETAVNTPDMPWKTAPSKGHIKGTVRNAANSTSVDGALVTLSGAASRTQYTDGTGFYAFIDLAPGSYTVTVTKAGFSNASASQNVTAGVVYTKDLTLTPGGCTYAGISSVAAQGVTPTNATIVWQTDVPSTSQVEYGTTSSYGVTTPLDSTLVQNHSVALSGLTPNTQYHYRVISTPSGGCTTASADQTFKTTAGSLPDPIIIESRTSSGTLTPAPAYSETPAWTGDSGAKSSAAGLTAPGSRYATSYAAKSASFVPNLTATGPYDVYVTWGTSGFGANTNFKVISSGTTVHNQNLDQNSAAGLNNQWVLLGQFSFSVGQSASNASVKIDGAATTNPRALSTPRLMSDAVKFVYRGSAIGDTEPPSIPGSLAATVVGTDQINLSWTESTDNVGVVAYRVYRNSVLVNSTSDPVYFDTGLSPNTSYSYQVSAVDDAGNESALTPVSAAVTLSVPPSLISVSSARVPEVWYSTNGFLFAANGGFGPGTVSKYRVAWNASPTQTWGSAGEFDWPASSVYFAAAAGVPYYLHLKGYNSAGVPNGSADLGPYLYDPTAPATPVVTDEGYYTASLTELSASWTASDPQSGIASSEYRILESGGPVVRDWTDVGAATNVTASGLALVLGKSYTFEVRQTNNAALVSSVGSSDGIKVVPIVASIGALKQMPDFTEFVLAGEKLVLGWGTGTYALELDRSSGILLLTAGPSVFCRARVGGKLSTSPTGERVVVLPDLVVLGPAPGVSALRAAGSRIGGAYSGPYGAPVGSSAGLNNTGLLLAVHGRVTFVGADFYALDDGSGLTDGEGHSGLRVAAGSLPLPAVGSYGSVSGFSSVHAAGPPGIPMLKAIEALQASSP